MKKLLLLTLMCVLSFGVVSCSSVTDPSEAYKGQTSQQIFKEGKEALQNRNFGEAIKHFEALDVQYPFEQNTQTAQLYLIYAYYMKEDYALAVSAADRFIRVNPTHPQVDYAYYIRGIADYYQNMGMIERLFSIDLAKRDLVQIQKAYQDFSDLISHYPNSQYAPAAHQYMVYLRNILADHEFEVAEYYYSRKAYVASANRARNVVAHYQGAPAVPQALRLLAKSYHALGLTKPEQDVLKVMQLNQINL